MAVKLGVGVVIMLGVLAAMEMEVMGAAPRKKVTFVFGDSLTEVGNNNYLQYSLAKSNFPWYGIDYPGGKPTGRFTNGRTIGDIICKLLDMTHSWMCSIDPFDSNILLTERLLLFVQLRNWESLLHRLIFPCHLTMIKSFKELTMHLEEQGYLTTQEFIL
ncbi:hypothetical protein QQ045_017488 [Rhodiola kirilowii]